MGLTKECSTFHNFHQTLISSEEDYTVSFLRWAWGDGEAALFLSLSLDPTALLPRATRQSSLKRADNGVTFSPRRTLSFLCRARRGMPLTCFQLLKQVILRCRLVTLRLLLQNCNGNTWIAFTSHIIHKYLFLKYISFIRDLLDLKEQSNINQVLQKWGGGASRDATLKLKKKISLEYICWGLEHPLPYFLDWANTVFQLLTSLSWAQLTFCDSV